MSSDAIRSFRQIFVISPFIFPSGASNLNAAMLAITGADLFSRAFFSTSIISHTFDALSTSFRRLEIFPVSWREHLLPTVIEFLPYLHVHAGSAWLIKACAPELRPSFLDLIVISVLGRLKLGDDLYDTQKNHLYALLTFFTLCFLRSAYYLGTTPPASTIVSIGMIFAAFSSGRIIRNEL